MAGFLNDAERARLNRFPDDVPHQDLVAYFTLMPSDKRQVPKTTAPPNRLGFCIQLGALRYLGFCPKEVVATPQPVVVYVAEQLGTPADCLKEYGSRSHDGPPRVVARDGRRGPERGSAIINPSGHCSRPDLTKALRASTSVSCRAAA